MKRTFFILLLLVNFPVPLLFCEEPDQNRLVGDWETKPYISQLGSVKTGFKFYENKNCIVSMQFIDAKLPNISQKGTFSINGNSLLINLGKENFNHKFYFEKDILVIIEGNWDTYRLLKK